MKKIIFVCLISIYSSIVYGQVMIGNTMVEVDTIYENLATPWEIKWGFNDRLWLTEKEGFVSTIDPQTGVRTEILDISSEVEVQGESGLLGMAFGTLTTQLPEVFLVYTYLDGGNILEKLVKYEYDGASLINEVVLIDSIPANSFHNGSRLLVLSDNTLLMTTGDAGDVNLSQNPNSLAGKVLRINQDGTIPSDNPFSNSLIYSLGHRNPQGLMLHPNGIIYTSEHGPSSNDEFQILLAGRNYGWPNVEGFCNLSSEMTFCSANNVVEPLFAWSPTIAPSDLVYYSNPGLPEFDDKILMGVLKDQMIVAFDLSSDGLTVNSEDEYLSGQFGRIRDLCVGPENEIYLLANNNSANQQIIVLRPDNLASLENQTSDHFKIYPNPAKNYITVESQLENGILDILDHSGRIVLSQKFGNLTTIDVSRIEMGAYQVIIKTADGSRIASQNFIKN